MKHAALIAASLCAILWAMNLNTYMSVRLERRIDDAAIASFAERYEKNADGFAPRYTRILLAILDGTSRDCLYSEAVAPRLHARWRAGGLRYAHVRSAAPTVTSPNMASLLTGATSYLHGVTANSPRLRARIKGQTVHECLKRRGLSSRVAGFEWYKEMLGNSVHLSTAECCGKDDSRELAGIALEMIRERRLPYLTQLHFLAPDNAAHETNSNSSPRYLKAIGEIDALLDEVIAALEAAYPGSLAVVTADHGMSADGTHGGSDIETLRVPLLFLAGDIPSSEIGREITSLSIAPTIAALAGARLPSLIAGTPLHELMDRSRAASYLSEAIDKKERIIESMRGYPSHALALSSHPLESLQERNDQLEREIEEFPRHAAEMSLRYQRLLAPLLLILFILWALYRSLRGVPVVLSLCGAFIAAAGLLMGLIDSGWSYGIASSLYELLLFTATAWVYRLLLDEPLRRSAAAPGFWREAFAALSVEAAILSLFFLPFHRIAPDQRVYPFRFFILSLACAFLAVALLYLLSRLESRGSEVERLQGF